MSFSPTAAVIVHSQVTIESGVLTTLQGEDGLLINRCSFSATRPPVTRSDINGREFLRVYGPLDAAWTVQARQLARSGLGNYHPGRNLSETSLAFANSDFIPFQVGTTFEENQNGQAVFIYENPSLNPGPGDLPEVEFTIRVAFADEDTLNYPTTNAGAAQAPTDFVDIPAQTAVELSAAARTALLADVFNGADSFDGAAMTAALYDASNTLLMGPVDITAWTTFDEPVHAYATRARNTAQIQWDDASFSDFTATYVRIERNGVILRDITLAAPLLIPAYSGVRAPINSLGVTLTWPVDGVAYSAAAMPSRVFATYVMGGLRATAIPSTDIYLTWVNGDPNATHTDLDAIPTIAANGTNFVVSGLTVTPAEQIGANNAPGSPGWVGTYITLYCGVNIVAKEKYAFTAISDKMHLNSTPPPALMTLDLAATPDP